jgi:hypothetical protein
MSTSDLFQELVGVDSDAHISVLVANSPISSLLRRKKPFVSKELCHRSSHASVTGTEALIVAILNVLRNLFIRSLVLQQTKKGTADSLVVLFEQIDDTVFGPFSHCRSPLSDA